MTARNSKQWDEQDHKALASWAADCAEHVLSLFENIHQEDKRPRNALEAARAWARDELAMTYARKAAFAAHAAARHANNESARHAARAAGHAAATAHVADHARHAANYAVKAVSATEIANGDGDAASAERDWQYEQLPEHLRSVMFLTASR